MKIFIIAIDTLSRLLIGICLILIYFIMWGVAFVIDIFYGILRFVVEFLTLIKITLVDVMLEAFKKLIVAVDPRKDWKEFVKEITSIYTQGAPREMIDKKQHRNFESAVDKAAKTLEMFSHGEEEK